MLAALSGTVTSDSGRGLAEWHQYRTADKQWGLLNVMRITSASRQTKGTHAARPRFFILFLIVTQPKFHLYIISHYVAIRSEAKHVKSAHGFQANVRCEYIQVNTNNTNGGNKKLY